MHGDDRLSPVLSVEVDAIEDLTPRIRAFTLVPVGGGPDLPIFTPGSHVAVRLKSGLERHYSLANDPADRNRYVVAVQREDAGRGGSIEMHARVDVGDVLTIGAPRNNFELAASGHHSLLLAGGIGITPLLSMARSLAREGKSFRLVYLTRSRSDAAYMDVLQGDAFAGRVHCHHDDQAGGPLDLTRVLAAPDPGTHLYCCGPTALMDAVAEASAAWPAHSVHFEHFTNEIAPVVADDRPFQVNLARTGLTVAVRADQTILDALLERGLDVDYSCCEGTCGTCVTPVLDGIADHRDAVLTASEKTKLIAICCSRARTDTITLDL